MVFDLKMTLESQNTPWHTPNAVRQFLHNVRDAVPLAIEQVDMMLRMVTAARDRVDTFLDLGCADGVLSAAMLDEYPNARGILVDDSDAMLTSARRHLDAHANRVQFVRADFNKPGWMADVTAGIPFDAIVSSFATHHSTDQRQRELYRELFDLLKPEGIFINIEHVASATRWTQSVWDDYMIDAIFGEALRASPGRARVEIAREYYANAQKQAHILAPLEVQCDWLREIGYDNVDCYLKVLELAMFGGQRPAEG